MTARSGTGPAEPEVGVWAALRRPELRRAAVVQTGVLLLVVLVWGVARGRTDERLDDLGLYAGIALSAVAFAGLGVSVWRAPGRRDLGARLMRTAIASYVLVALAALQGLLALLLSRVAGELGRIVLGSAVGLVVGPLAGGLVLVFVAGALLGFTDAPAGTATWRRLAPAVLLLGMVVTGLGVALGSRVQPGGDRDVLGLLVALLGLPGNVLSSGWLWTGRAGALAVAASLVVIVRTERGATSRSSVGPRPTA